MVTQHNPQDADALLERGDDELLAWDEEQGADLEARALEVDFLGLRLRAPGRLDIQVHSELPLLLLRRSTGLRDWQVEPSRNAVLVGVERDTGVVRAGWAWPTHKRLNVEHMPRSLLEAARPGPEDAEAVMATVKVIHGRAALQLPWVASEQSLTLLNHDWVSNTVRVRLEAAHAEPSPAWPAEEARRLVSELGERLSYFQRRERSPELRGPGAALSAPREARAEDSGFLVHGTLRVPAPAGCTVAPAGAGEPQLPAVVLRATLLLVKLDELSPARAELEIPVFTDQPVLPGEQVEGFFCLDLYTAGIRQQLLDSDTLLYLVAGDYVTGPHSVEARP